MDWLVFVMLFRKWLAVSVEGEGQNDDQEKAVAKAKPSRTLSHISRRSLVEIEFRDINYKIPKGRKGNVPSPLFHSYGVGEGTLLNTFTLVIFMIASSP